MKDEKLDDYASEWKSSDWGYTKEEDEFARLTHSTDKQLGKYRARICENVSMDAIAVIDGIRLPIYRAETRHGGECKVGLLSAHSSHGRLCVIRPLDEIGYGGYICQAVTLEMSLDNGVTWYGNFEHMNNALEVFKEKGEINMNGNEYTKLQFKVVMVENDGKLYYGVKYRPPGFIDSLLENLWRWTWCTSTVTRVDTYGMNFAMEKPTEFVSEAAAIHYIKEHTGRHNTYVRNIDNACALRDTEIVELRAGKIAITKAKKTFHGKSNIYMEGDDTNGRK